MATFVGVGISLFTITTGIDAVFFYSNSLFVGLDITPTMISLIVGIVNLIAAGVGAVLLGYFGRRTLLLAGHSVMTISLFAIGIGMLTK